MQIAETIALVWYALGLATIALHLVPPEGSMNGKRFVKCMAMAPILWTIVAACTALSIITIPCGRYRYRMVDF